MDTKIQTGIQEEADAGSYNPEVGNGKRQWFTSWWGRDGFCVGFKKGHDCLRKSGFQKGSAILIWEDVRK